MAVPLLFCLILLPVRAVPSSIPTSGHRVLICSPSTCCFHFPGSQPAQLSILEDLIFIALYQWWWASFPCVWSPVCLLGGRKLFKVFLHFHVSCWALVFILPGAQPYRLVFSRHCGWQVPLMQSSLILIHSHFLILCFIGYTLSVTINTWHCQIHTMKFSSYVFF